MCVCFRKLNKESYEKVQEAFEKDNPYNLRFVEMKTLARFEAASMAERHVISPEFASDNNGRALLISPEEDICVMLNEEDHIRIQVMKSGFALHEAYGIADEIDDLKRYDQQNESYNDLDAGVQAPINYGVKNCFPIHFN